MLSPTSPTQRTLSEEDSSGSDAGSEVSLEPETDRFGFILTNGSTAGSVGPSPELVRHRETKWLSLIGQWDRILLKKSSKVKVQCQKGIPASVRAKCWPLLCGATEKMKQNGKLYESLNLKPGLQSWVDVIERDLDRQFPFHEMFLSKDGHGQRCLFDVLKAYTQYQPEEGYCQAQGPVAAVLLMNMPAEEAFWCLVQISEQYLPGYYSPLLEGVLFDAAMLTWVLKKACPAAHKHLQHHGVEPLMFATDWLMCLFTRHLPFNTLLRVWDLFFCYGVRVLLQVAVVLVRRVLGRAEQRKLCQGQMETLEKLRGVREEVQEEDDTFIAEVCSVPLSSKDLEKQTEKELKKWRKDKPSSTFDPRGRCHGYRMAYARARENEEEQERKKREKGNLSVPAALSASTLSLSPSLLHKKWRKGGKANADELEGGKRLVRHLSMAGKEDLKSWIDEDFKKGPVVQEEEDVVSEGHKAQSESKLSGQTEQKELLQEPKEMDKTQNIPTENAEEETVIVKEEIEKVETRATEKEVSEIKETEEQTEETNPCPVKDQTVENILLPPEQTSHCDEEEKLVSEGRKAQSESKPPGQTEQEELLQEPEKMDKTQNIPTENAEEETVIVKEETEKVETRTTEKEVSEIKETEESEMLSDQTEETNPCPAKDQTVENILQPPEQTPHREQEEKVDTVNTLQVLEEQSHKSTNQEIEIKDTNEAAEKHVAENNHTAAVEVNHTEVLRDAEADANIEAEMQVSVDSNEKQMTQVDVNLNESTEIENMQQTQVDTVTDVSETRTETSLDSETHTDVEAAELQDPQTDTETQQEQEEVITQTEEITFEEKYHSTESLVESQKTEEFHTQTTEIDVLAHTQEKAEENAAAQDELKAEITQRESDQHIDADREANAEEDTLILDSPECIQGKEGSPDETETEAEVAKDPSEESNEAIASEPTQEKQEVVLTVHSDPHADSDACICDQTNTEETPTQTNDETEDSVISAEKEETEALNPNSESDGKSSLQVCNMQAPQQPTNQVPVEEEKGTENFPENTAGEDEVFLSTESTDESVTHNNTQVQDKDCHSVKEQSEPLVQTSGRRSSRSSGDLCVRKSSSSRGSRLARRLSEDLFTSPQKSSQSQVVPNHPEESKSNPGAMNPKQSAPDVTLPAEVTEQQHAEPPKRFGLFRRLRGEQHKNSTAKGKPKMQVPKILIQDFSDGTGTGKTVEEPAEEKLSSRERRRRRRQQERKEKEEERLKKKREKELGKEKERERRKPQTRGKSFQVQKEKSSEDVARPGKTGSQTLRYSDSYAEAYF
ncbi:trichohyalin [Stegastes partitus]|uniref:Carabin n=1 Tax=Stegastes partitus TaxID=144197 RepID=A0A3B5AJA6_9TELE|nr:PREDICTED: carabin [Stegastes partitus]